jgi:hypothetical protein
VCSPFPFLPRLSPVLWRVQCRSLQCSWHVWFLS